MSQFTNFQVQNNDGSNFDLYEYTGTGSVLLIFFRGAWCSHCKRQLQDLQTHLADFSNLNIKLVAISNDSQLKSSLLKTFLRLSFPILSDPELKIIDSLELRTIYKDQVTSKPAVFFMNKDYELKFNYIGKDPEDRPSVQQIIDLIKKS